MTENYSTINVNLLLSEIGQCQTLNRVINKPSGLPLKPGFHYPSLRPELTGDRFPLPVNMGRVDGRAFDARLTGVNTARQLG